MNDNHKTMIQPPPMRLVYKGWWICAERPVQLRVLERYDQLQGHLRGRPWWRRLNARWKRP